MLKIEKNNGVISVEADAEMFIVPNKACTCDDYFDPERRAEEMIKLCQDNGKEFDTNDKLIQIWSLSEELGSDNLPDHRFILGGRYYLSAGRIPSSLPKSLIDIKEGESVDIVFKGLKCECVDEHFDSEIECNLTLHMKANQLSYRYRRFGAFEQVLADVCC